MIHKINTPCFLQLAVVACLTIGKANQSAIDTGNCCSYIITPHYLYVSWYKYRGSVNHWSSSSSSSSHNPSENHSLPSSAIRAIHREFTEVTVGVVNSLGIGVQFDIFTIEHFRLLVGYKSFNTILHLSVLNTTLRACFQNPVSNRTFLRCIEPGN